MKKVKILLMGILFSFLLMVQVEAASNPYPKTQSLTGVKIINCTWYAWEQAKEHGVILPSWGNAGNWYNNAKKVGYSVGKEPRANSIFVLSSTDGYGHVGYVVSVSDNDIITNESYVGYVEEIPCADNPDKTCYYMEDSDKMGVHTGDTRSINEPDIIGYIYLDKVPVKNNSTSNSSNNNSNKNNDINKSTNDNQSNKNTTNNSNEKPTEVIKEQEKSNNNYLKSLEIVDYNINFNKDVNEYSLDVDNATDIVLINAFLEDEKAMVEGVGPKELEVGLNTYKISVTAENGEVREYTIIITRAEKQEENQEVSNDLIANKESILQNNFKKIILVIGFGIITLGILLVLFMIKKKKLKKVESK